MGTLLQRIQAARHFDAGAFLPFEIGQARAGWVRRDRVVQLLRWPAIFRTDGQCVRLDPSLATEPARTAALCTVARALASEGTITGWRDETYAVRAWPQEEPLLHIERAAMRWFGFTSSAAHLNGYVQARDGMRIWIARRSPTKSIDPGMLDTLVGGGIPAGQVAWQTVQRECGEEAGIDTSLAAQALPAGAFQVCHQVPDGLHSEILYAHDLALPHSFAPQGVDGEVGEFMLLDPSAVVDRVANGEFTVEAGLLALDFLLRRQAIGGVDPAVSEALENCRLARA